MNRKKIADGVHFTVLTDKKFKHNVIALLFITNLKSSTAANNAILPRLLSKCCDRFNTMAKLNKKLSGLYSTSLDWTATNFGDHQYASLEISMLGNKYAIYGEDIVAEAAAILRDCFISPYFENGVFPKQSVDVEKQNQIDDNNERINDKPRYAYMKAYEYACDGEPAALLACGTNEEIEEITQETATAAYHDMLRSLQIEIICAGESDFNGIDDIFIEAFGSIERSPEILSETKISEPKNEPLYVTENLDIEQSRLVMIYKTPIRDIHALRVMSAIYGGTEFSKLFSIVREKMSLCYSCYSTLDFPKGLVIVQCGIDNNNLEKAEKECLNQLKEIAKGNFTDDDIDKAKLSLVTSLRSIGDRVSGVAAYCMASILYRDYGRTPEAEIEKTMSITREQIIEAAKSLTLDTVYSLTSDEKEEK